MILTSTIERNYTVKNHPQYEQKTFHKNKVRGTNNIEYIVLNDLQTDEIHNNMEQALLPPFINKSKSFIQVKTPHSFIQHDVGNDRKRTEFKNQKRIDLSDEKEILDISSATDKARSIGNDNKIEFWNLVNHVGHVGKYRPQHKINVEQSGSGTNDLQTISEFETPPPVSQTSLDQVEKSLEIEKLPVSDSIYEMEQTAQPFHDRTQFTKRHMESISEVEEPPPPRDAKKVYGQWTSSKFAGNVLNYLKSINFHNKEKRVPPTIPLTKVSDSFPYSSDFKLNVVRPPIQFQRRNSVLIKQVNNQYPIKPQPKLKRLHKRKRDIYQPEINVQILEEDVRSTILRTHAQTLPRHVEVTSRGEPKKIIEHRFYRKIPDLESAESSNEIFKPTPFNKGSKKNHHNRFSSFDIHKSNTLLTVLPFLKSVEYFTEESDSESHQNSNDMYTKSLSNGNKWHNVKSYNNDYTPRLFNMNPGDGKSSMDNKIAEINRKHPSIRLKYKPETNQLIQSTNDAFIIKGRELAQKVSNQSDHNKESISILKYNHGFLPTQEKKIKTAVSMNSLSKSLHPRNNVRSRNSFDKHVKIGNALNEQHVIGVNEEEKKQSFVGGNEKIPDIQRYRSDIDQETENVPSSLKPRVCRNIELYDNILYVQPDESIDMTHILSPVKMKNIGIEFIIQNYKKCSLEESTFRRSSLLLLNWSKTPVRLFGGAFPKKTTDLCGFF